jgi:hypothetical protein
MRSPLLVNRRAIRNKPRNLHTYNVVSFILRFIDVPWLSLCGLVPERGIEQPRGAREMPDLHIEIVSPVRNLVPAYATKGSHIT